VLDKAVVELRYAIEGRQIDAALSHAELVKSWKKTSASRLYLT
jgi:hypothetical protein